MPRPDRIQAECLSLLAGLYAALADELGYCERRAACEAWLFKRRGTNEPMASFLRHQLGRAAEARQVARELHCGGSGKSAAIMVDSRGRVLAAGPEAWPLLGSGSPARDPLQLPEELQAHLGPMLKTGAPFPRALRISRHNGSDGLAGVLLGIDPMPRAHAAPRNVATLLLWDLGAQGPAEAIAGPGLSSRLPRLDADQRAASDE